MARYTETLKELQFKREKRFVLFGEETYLKDSFIAAAQSINPSIFSYYPGEEEEAKSALCSINLFEENQTIILQYFDEMKPVGFKEIIPKFEGLLIIVLSDKANIKIKALTEIIGLCTPVKCGKMSEYGPEYPAWLVSKATERGYVFIDDSENALFKKVGPDMALLSKELEKLMIFKEHSKSITVDDIDKITSFSVVGSTYKILDLLLKRDIPKVLESFDLYLKNSDDIGGLLFFLGHYFEKLYRMVLMAGNGISADGIASILNISPYLIKSNYLPRALSLGRVQLARCIANIVELETSLRTSSLKQTLIDKFIFSFK
jgi:DNA polymerase III delta subunit